MNFSTNTFPNRTDVYLTYSGFDKKIIIKLSIIKDAWQRKIERKM